VALATATVVLASVSASATAAATPTRGFLSHPTDQLGVPGAPEGAQLTPQGSLFTGRLELTFRVGEAQRPWRQLRRTLDGTGLPVYAGTRRVDGLDHRLTAFAVDRDGVPVVHLRMRVGNRSHRARSTTIGMEIGWVARGMTQQAPYPGGPEHAPYRFPRPVVSDHPGGLSNPGEAFDRGWVHRWVGDALHRDGSPLLRVRTSPRGFARAATTTARASRPGSVTATRRSRVTVPARGVRHVDVVVPLRAVPAGSPVLQDRHDAALRRLRDAWRPVLDRAMGLHTPEPALNRAWRNGLLAMLVPRTRLDDGRWVQTVNLFQYHASWIRDTVMITHAMGLLNLDREAGEGLEFLTTWQREDGLLNSRAGQLDGMGQALWGFGDHVARTGDADFARRILPATERAMEWVARRLDDDPRWILPAGDPGDNEMVAGHATGDLVWLAGGARRAVAIPELLGDAALAARWRALAARVEAVAEARLREAARDGVVPPVLDADGGERWGEMWMHWPTGVLAADDPLVRATMDAAARDEREGLALWSRRLHLYLGLRRLHTELRAGRSTPVVAGVYAYLAHLTSTGGTWEQSSRPYGRRDAASALGPHAWSAADFASLVHDMLVREEGDGVRILDVVPPAWLRPGARTSVRRAATAHGVVDVDLDARRDGAVVRWRADVPEGTPLRLRVPAGVRDVRIPGRRAGAREVVLPGREGRMRIRWSRPRAVRDADDADAVRERLRRAYRRAGHPW